MTKYELEEQVKIRQEAERRETQRKLENAEDIALLIGTQSSNPRIAEFCKGVIRGKIIGNLIMIIMFVGLIVGALHHMPWLFTVPSALCIVYLFFKCKDAGVTAIGVFLAVILAAFWAFMRFVVMPFCW